MAARVRQRAIESSANLGLDRILKRESQGVSFTCHDDIACRICPDGKSARLGIIRSIVPQENGEQGRRLPVLNGSVLGDKPELAGLGGLAEEPVSREVGGECVAGDINIAGLIHRDITRAIGPRSAEIGCQRDYRIDNQRLGVVVAAEPEGNRTIRIEFEAARQFAPLLEDARTMLMEAVFEEDEIADRKTVA